MPATIACQLSSTTGRGESSPISIERGTSNEPHGESRNQTPRLFSWLTVRNRWNIIRQLISITDFRGLSPQKAKTLKPRISTSSFPRATKREFDRGTELGNQEPHTNS